MGNTESADLAANNGKRHHSQSPAQTRSSSVRRAGPSMTAEPLRRARTTRQKDKTLRRAVCPVTGLTLHQKALLARKWNRMDRGTIYEMGRRMFEQVYAESPQYLAYIELKNEPNWWNHINFKIHVQRFVTVLIESMRRLKEPSSSIDILRDFGAIYAKYPKRVSAVYFEKLANAMNDAAAQLQEGDHLEVEKTQSRIDEISDNSSMEEKVTGDNTSAFCTSCTSLSAQTPQSQRRLPRPLMTRYSESQMQALKEESYCSSCTNSRRCSDDEHSKSICPITAEAWLVLSAFLANQIKFGYELEKLLLSEMNKLGLDLPGAGRGPHIDSDERNPRTTFAVEPPTQIV